PWLRIPDMAELAIPHSGGRGRHGEEHLGARSRRAGDREPRADRGGTLAHADETPVAGRRLLVWVESAPVVAHAHLELPATIDARDLDPAAGGVLPGVRHRLGRDADDLILDALREPSWSPRPLDVHGDPAAGEAPVCRLGEPVDERGRLVR